MARPIPIIVPGGLRETVDPGMAPMGESVGKMLGMLFGKKMAEKQARAEEAQKQAAYMAAAAPIFTQEMAGPPQEGQGPPVQIDEQKRSLINILSQAPESRAGGAEILTRMLIPKERPVTIPYDIGGQTYNLTPQEYAQFNKEREPKIFGEAKTGYYRLDEDKGPVRLIEPVEEERKRKLLSNAVSADGYYLFDDGTKSEIKAKKPEPSEYEKGRGERFSEQKRLEIVSKFNADPMVRRVEQMDQFSQLILDVAGSDNPVGHASLETLMARASGEVGNLSEADKKPFGGSRALDAKTRQYFSELYSGKKTPENLAFISKLAETFQNTGQVKKKKLAKERAAQYSKALGGKLSPEEITEMLIPGEWEPADRGTQEPKANTAKAITIKSDADYDKLPPGSIFMGPDGKQRRKP